MLRKTSGILAVANGTVIGGRNQAAYVPKIGTKLFRVRNIHRESLSNADRKRSETGILKRKFQVTVSQFPSLYFYLQQNCGLSFPESLGLLKAGRLYAGGKPLSGSQALEVQMPVGLIPDLCLEILMVPSGLRVPVLDRHLHRFYGFMGVTSKTEIERDEAEPRSFMHLVLRDAIKKRCEVDVEVIPGRTEKRYADLFGDSFDALSSPNLLIGHGARKGVTGLAILTNDVSLPPYFVSDLGFSATWEATFPLGAPLEVVETIRAEADVHLSQLVMLPELKKNFSPTASISTRLNGQHVLVIDTHNLTSKLSKAIRAAKPESMACVRCGDFELSSVGVGAGEWRSMHKEELATLQGMAKKYKINRIVANLRASMEPDEPIF